MTDSFVDLTYRGLAVAKRVKLTQVRPSTGFVELATPMPVGTLVQISSTEEGVAFEALVQDSIEQVSGRDLAPGMTLRPRLDGNAVTWWKALVALPDVVKVEAAPVVGIVRSKRASNAGGIPELMDDGRNTAVQAAVDPAKLGVEPEPEKDTQVIPVMDVPIVDDGRATTAMDAVDLAALGLSVSGEIPIVKEVATGAESIASPALPGGAAAPNGGAELIDDDGDVKSGPAGSKKKKRRR